MSSFVLISMSERFLITECVINNKQLPVSEVLVSKMSAFYELTVWFYSGHNEMGVILQLKLESEN